MNTAVAQIQIQLDERKSQLKVEVMPPGEDQMRLSRQLVQTILAVIGCACLGSPSGAMDLNGAWATQPDTGRTQQSACDKVFVKEGGTISFRLDSELHGDVFVIEEIVSEENR